MNDGRRQKVVEKQSSANKTSKHIIFASDDDDDDEDDSGLGGSVLQNNYDVQQTIDKRLIANKKKSTVDQTQTEVSANHKSKHTTFTSDDDDEDNSGASIVQQKIDKKLIANKKKSSVNQRSVKKSSKHPQKAAAAVKEQASTSHNQPESDDDDSDIEVAVVSRKPKRRSDANNAKLIPKKKKSLSSNVHDDDESVNIDELSDEASAHDNSDDKPVRSLPQKETTLSHPKKDKEELYERRLSLPNEDIILNAHDDFEFVKPKKYGKPQLYIFIPDNKEFCYKFTRVQDGSSRYRCLGCFAKSRKINVRTDEDKQLYVTLSKYRSGEYFVRMGTKIHCCEPIKYESQKYQGKEMYDCYEYFYYRKIERPASLNLAIPHPENKEFCYKFFYLPSKSHYQCIDCDRQKKKLTMVRRTDCEEDDYFMHDFSKHICEPCNISFLNSPEFIPLENKGKFYENEINKKKNGIVIDGSGFELRKKDKIPNGTLIVFHPEDNSLCYEYTVKPSTSTYYCTNCLSKSKRYVTAKLITNEENGEMSITLGRNQHVCAPQIMESKADVNVEEAEEDSD